MQEPRQEKNQQNSGVWLPK